MRLASFQQEICHDAHRFVQWVHRMHEEDPDGYPLDAPHDTWRELFSRWRERNPERTVSEEPDPLQYLPDGA